MLSDLLTNEVILQVLVDTFHPFAAVDLVLLKNNLMAENSLYMYVFLKHNQKLNIKNNSTPQNREILSEPQMNVSFMKGEVADNSRPAYFWSERSVWSGHSVVFVHENCSALSIQIQKLDNFKDTIDSFKHIFSYLERSISDMFSHGIEGGNSIYPWLRITGNGLHDYLNHKYFSDGYTKLQASHMKPSVVLEEESKRQERTAKIIERFINKLEQRLEGKNWLEQTFFSSDLKQLLKEMKKHKDAGRSGFPSSYYRYQGSYYQYQDGHPEVAKILTEIEQEVDASVSHQIR